MKKSLLLLLLATLLFVDANGQKPNLKREVDKITGAITIRSPYFGKGIAATTPLPLGINKVIQADGLTEYYLRLLTYGSTINIGASGVIVLFKDGSKIEYPNASIKVDATTGNIMSWQYSAFIPLNEQQVKLFSEKEVDMFRLYIYDGKPHYGSQAKKFMVNTQAILDAK
jgi:hypothetical protein